MGEIDILKFFVLDKNMYSSTYTCVKLQLHFYVQFWSRTLGKDMNPLYFQFNVK